MRLIIIGSGYVGLVSGTCLAELGHDVLCVDCDRTKIANLRAGRLPIFEPKLAEMVARNLRNGRLHFAETLPTIGLETAAVIIAVGTPPLPNGSADLSAILAAARDIAGKATHNVLVAIKSTVPVATGDLVEAVMIGERPDLSIMVASNPEFLREGSAIDDFMGADRIVVGTNSDAAQKILKAVYAPLSLKGIPIVCVDRRGSELIKYAANAFLATKIAFINEIADFCEAIDADIDQVAAGVGLDRRIGSAFLQAGPGYGGSCFPKDTSALLTSAQDHAVNLRLVETTIASNEARRRGLGQRVTAALGGSVAGRTISVLGITFKPNTDDTRDAPGLALAAALQSGGARLRVFDPKGMSMAQPQLQKAFFAEDAYQCAQGSDCIVLATHWAEFASLDPVRLAQLVKRRVLVDLRNGLDAEAFSDAGFVVHGIGRRRRLPKVRSTPVVITRRRMIDRRQSATHLLNGSGAGLPPPEHNGLPR
ncbi:MAG TPA: UDP-glucose/GDP-mannose dehydrogenase family protein [Devosia sp.]|jgi:UDPglucose 6-dehydrogenase|nr:UDP-glucose/GDP-mannose dehydrogenase family protein [Devosia sp.]